MTKLSRNEINILGALGPGLPYATIENSILQAETLLSRKQLSDGLSRLYKKGKVSRIRIPYEEPSGLVQWRYLYSAK